MARDCGGNGDFRGNFADYGPYFSTANINPKNYSLQPGSAICSLAFVFDEVPRSFSDASPVGSHGMRCCVGSMACAGASGGAGIMVDGRQGGAVCCSHWLHELA